MHNVFSFVAIQLIATYYGIDGAEYGITKSLQSKTEGNITQLGSSVARSYLACLGKCLQVALCDSSVYCLGSCLLFSTRNVSIGIDMVNQYDGCRLSSFPSRLVCGRHGVKNGQSCTCDEGWHGTYCDIPPLGEIFWVEQFNSQTGNETTLDMALRNGVGITIVEHYNASYMYYKPTSYASGETAYAQTIFEMGRTGNSFSPFRTFNKMFQKNGKVLIVSSDGLNLSRTSNLTWFTKDYSRGIPFFTRNADTVTLGSLGDCFRKIQSGGEIRAVVDDEGALIDVDLVIASQEIKFLFPLQVEVNNTEDIIFRLTSSWSLSVGTPSSRILYKLNVDFNGDVSSRRYHQIPTNTMKFFLDPAWQLVYRLRVPTENIGVQGSFQSLKEAILSGKRLRVIFGDERNLKTLTTRYIQITNGGSLIEAFSAAQPFYKNIKENVSPRVRFYRITTEGDSAFCSVDLGSTGVQNSEDKIKANSTWFAENRQWYQILKLTNDTNILSGSVQRLILAAQSGKRIRLVLDLYGVFLIMDIDNAEISTNDDILLTSGPHISVFGNHCRLVTYFIDSSFSVKMRMWSLANNQVDDLNVPVTGQTFYTDDPLA